MANKAPNIVSFKNELKKLMTKHGCYLLGNIRLQFADHERLDFTKYQCEILNEMDCGRGIFDRMGPFICGSTEEKERASHHKTKNLKVTIMDTDLLLANGVKSPINQKAFHNRREWKEHLKANGCVEIGNDLNNAKPCTEIRGDFNCREELGKATYEVMEKYGH